MIYDAAIHPLPLSAMLDLQGEVSDVLPRLQRLGLQPPAPAHASRRGDLEVFLVGPEHWLLRGPLDQENMLLEALNAEPVPSDTLVLAVSDVYSVIGISGPQAREILAVASPLDVDPRTFAADGATLTEAFGQKVLLIRRSTGFDMVVERSYLPMMGDYLSRINTRQIGP